MVAVLPVVVPEAWPPVRSTQQGLQGAGQVDKEVTHQEEPKGEEEEVAFSSAAAGLVVP